MKKINKLKLNNLNKVDNNKLTEKEMLALQGGKCGWKCLWDSDNSKAVRRNWSPGYCGY